MTPPRRRFQSRAKSFTNVAAAANGTCSSARSTTPTSNACASPTASSRSNPELHHSKKFSSATWPNRQTHHNRKPIRLRFSSNMSTATNNSTTTHADWHGKTMFWRFVWKEFRMIRSLWAAVAIMGLLVQCAERMLLTGATDFALTLLYTALSASVLYAVGAAATTFSVEHEEETY